MFNFFKIHVLGLVVRFSSAAHSRKTLNRLKHLKRTLQRLGWRHLSNRIVYTRLA
ncbi:MAG: hypothetical protein ACI8Z5_000829 [Lentimonas sp.]|jgi:hypothetical protein